MFKTAITSTATCAVFRLVFLLSRACCLLPVKITKAATHTSIAFSWRYYLTSLLGLAIFVSGVLHGLVVSYQIEDVYNVRMKEFSSMFITVLDDSYLILTCVVAAVITPLTFRDYSRYMKCLSETDAVLRYQLRSKKKSYVVLFLTLTLTVGVLSFDAYMWGKIYMKHVSVPVYLLYALPFYCTFFIVMLIEINYWYLVHNINVRLMYLNQCMKSSYVHRKLDGNNVRIVKDAKAVSLPKSPLNFTKAYELLFEASCSVNSFYGINILLIIIGCLIHLLVTPYDLYLELKYHDQEFIYPQLCWMASHILRLLLIVEPCHVATQQVKIASSMLCKFLSTDLTDKEQSQIEAFSMQLLHCRLQFTACDLIVLDRSLLTAIAGGVTTYLVILFQFEKKE